MDLNQDAFESFKNFLWFWNNNGVLIEFLLFILFN